MRNTSAYFDGNMLTWKHQFYFLSGNKIIVVLALMEKRPALIRMPFKI